MAGFERLSHDLSPSMRASRGKVSLAMSTTKASIDGTAE